MFRPASLALPAGVLRRFRWDAAGRWGGSVTPAVHRSSCSTGAGQTRHAWGSTAEALANAGWYTVAMDPRGHGDSDWPHHDGRYTTDSFAGDVLAIVDALGQPPCAGRGVPRGDGRPGRPGPLDPPNSSEHWSSSTSPPEWSQPE